MRYINTLTFTFTRGNSGYKAEQLKHHGTRPLQFPPPFLSLALIHASLSRVGFDQAAGKRPGTAESTTVREKRQVVIYSYTSVTSHTLSGLPDGVVQHYTCLIPEALHSASP